jgi:C-terminal processing protease CtpA/Prc
MKATKSVVISLFTGAAVLAAAGVFAALAQESKGPAKISTFDRDRARDMLRTISNDVKRHYYDPKYHGVDWDANVRKAEQLIDASGSLNKALSEVAAALDALNDSHTFFLPPPRPYKHDYGWQIAMIGDRCFVMRVRPKSDAEAKGVKRGDEVLGVNGYQPTRENLWKMRYVFDVLRPQAGLRVDLRPPGGQARQVDMAAAMRETKRVADLTNGSDIWDLIRESENAEHLGRARWADLGEDIGILKYPGFYFSDSETDGMIKQARKKKALILDLRGNPGGSIETLKWFLGGVFDKEVKIGDRLTRDGSKPMVVKGRGQSAFSGKLVVLLDSKSASAAELFALVVQIEKRGIVLGDQSAGAVMEARHYNYQAGTDTVVFYGASVTDADLIMTDGKSLEHTGVVPDEVLLARGEDLAASRDTVLARAVELCGGKVTPEAADAMFPFEWPRQ